MANPPLYVLTIYRSGESKEFFTAVYYTFRNAEIAVWSMAGMKLELKEDEYAFSGSQWVAKDDEREYYVDMFAEGQNFA